MIYLDFFRIKMLIIPEPLLYCLEGTFKRSPAIYIYIYIQKPYQFENYNFKKLLHIFTHTFKIKFYIIYVYFAHR